MDFALHSPIAWLMILCIFLHGNSTFCFYEPGYEALCALLSTDFFTGITSMLANSSQKPGRKRG